MDLHQRQKDNKFVFSKPTIIEGDIVNNIDETQPTLSSLKEKRQKKIKQKRKKNRCTFEGCKKKLKLTDMACKCKQRYCQKHRLPESHSCSWDPKCTDEMQRYVTAAGLDKAIRFSKLESI